MVNAADPVEQEQASVQDQPARQLYNYLLVMAHLMHRINPGSSWQMRLRQHIQYPSRPTESDGFSAGLGAGGHLAGEDGYEPRRLRPNLASARAPVAGHLVFGSRITGTAARQRFGLGRVGSGLR